MKPFTECLFPVDGEIVILEETTQSEYKCFIIG